MISPRHAAPVALCAVLALSACTDNRADGGGDGAIAVTSTETECTVEPLTAAAGTIAFDVSNSGTQVTEFYLLREDGVGVVGEAENIGPGLTRRFVVTAAPGDYVTACKPGMTGDGIRGTFTVTSAGAGDGAADTGATAEIAPLLDQATTDYAAFVQTEADDLAAQTTTFAELYVAGDDDAARALYPVARTPWERIEPVAESFGDLDPRLDAREADLAEGEPWTGWHRIEKDLWPPDGDYVALTSDERVAIADQLVADTNELVGRIGELAYTPDQLGNGAKELLDEVATGKVTGEEEIWSHTDLWDFQANIDGARKAFEVLRPALEVKDPELATSLDAKFDDVQTELDQYRSGDGFVPYTDLTAEQVRDLADVVNALAEPLSGLTAAVLL